MSLEPDTKASCNNDASPSSLNDIPHTRSRRHQVTMSNNSRMSVSQNNLLKEEAKGMLKTWSLAEILTLLSVYGNKICQKYSYWDNGIGVQNICCMDYKWSQPFPKIQKVGKMSTWSQVRQRLKLEFVFLHTWLFLHKYKPKIAKLGKFFCVSIVFLLARH